jgi:hypothetical protein
VASTTTTTDPDHYKCYSTLRSSFDRRDVSLEDQFMTTTASVLRPSRFCNPANKNNEGISDPTAHLNCYKISEPRFQPIDVVVENQFGQQNLTVTKADTLCVPAEKDMVPSDLNINHFKCYKVRATRGTPAFTSRDVSVMDQFEDKMTTVIRPALLCNPVDKNGEGMPFPENHLTCFKIKDVSGQPAFQAQPIEVSDQFVTEDLNLTQRADCSRVRMLCVPSSKRLASPSGAFLDLGAGVLD